MNNRFLAPKVLAALVLGGIAACTADAADAPTKPVVTTKHHTVVIGGEEAIAARRASLAIRRRFGVNPVASKLQAGASKYIRSSGTVVANPRIDAVLTIALLRDAAGSPAPLGTSTVESSDPTIATAASSGSELAVSLTGKLGNAYLTTYDAAGNATAKVMVLSSTPQAGTAIVDDESLEPTALMSGDVGAPELLATDFLGTTHDQLLSGLYTVVPVVGQRAGAIQFRTQADYQRFADAAAASAGTANVRAIYFPGKDLLVTTASGNLIGQSGPGGAGYELSIGAAISQADFGRYVDFGGILASSPLHDPQANEDAVLAYTSAPSGLGAIPPVQVGVVRADGKRVLVDDAGFAEASVTATRRLVAYPREGEPVGEALTCEASKDAGPIDWRSLYSTAETTFGVEANWKEGKVDISMGLAPHFRVGGQIGFSGEFEGKCEKTLFEVPVAEWGVPLLGNVSVMAPIKLEFEVKANGSVTVMTPRIELGSAKDVTKPGKLGFSYTTDGGFAVDRDVAVQTPYRTLAAVDGSREGNATVEVKAGIAASLALEAQVKAWIFKADVRADIGDVLFGLEDTASLTVKPATRTFDATNEFKLGIFPTFAPTLHVDLPFFHASFNLFDLKLPDIAIDADAKHSSSGDSLVPLETPHTTKTESGADVPYVTTPDSLEIRGLGDISGVEPNVHFAKDSAGSTRTILNDTSIAAGINGSRINITGTSIDVLLAQTIAAHYPGQKYDGSFLIVIMGNGQRVRFDPAVPASP